MAKEFSPSSEQSYLFPTIHCSLTYMWFSVSLLMYILCFSWSTAPEATHESRKNKQTQGISKSVENWWSYRDLSYRNKISRGTRVASLPWSTRTAHVRLAMNISKLPAAYEFIVLHNIQVECFQSLLEYAGKDTEWVWWYLFLRETSVGVGVGDWNYVCIAPSLWSYAG